MEHAETTAAIEQVWEGAPGAWQIEALAAIEHVAWTTEYLTTDKVWATGLKRPHEPRAMGAAMRVAAREGWIVATNKWAKSGQRVCHNRPMRVWRSTLYRPS